MASPDTYDQDLFLSLKAEAFCAELLGNGFSFNKIIYQPAGSFRKSYRPDIDIAPEKDGEKETIKIVVNRDGIYDKLPEGLFHQTKGGSKTAGISEMVGEFRRFRDEERSARKFFQPLEQEFFRYSTLVEQEERNLLLGMLGGKLDDTFLEFWDISKDIPSAVASVLVRILPWACRIKGNMELTAKALGLMLDKKVQVREKFRSHQQGAAAIASMLGEAALGVDMVTGMAFNESSVVWEFTIDGIASGELSSYLPENPYGKFLRRFVELFIPVEIDEVFIYEIENTANETSEALLGYSLVL